MSIEPQDGRGVDEQGQAAVRRLIDASSGNVTIVVEGEIDLAAAAVLRAALADMTNARRVIIDLGGTAFMDCAGFAPIAELRERLDSGGLLIRNPTRRVRRLLGLLGQEHLIEPDDNDRTRLGVDRR